MSVVDPAAWEERRERLTAVLSNMAKHAMVQATSRCPYKNRFDECTAKFGCRNQRPPIEAAEPQPDRHGRLRPVQAGPGSGLKLCRGDDKLDYRSAWDTGE